MSGLTKEKIALFDAIGRWPIDARDEPDTEYFVKFRGISGVEEGRICFVIGRKGSGKTAIAEYIREKPPIESKCRILSFNNFPFNLLYDQKDSSYKSGSSYITIWKYVIYSAVCSQMKEDLTVDEECRNKLAKIFNMDFDAALGQSIREITQKSFGVSLAGSGVNFSKSLSENNDRDIQARTDALEELIKNYAGKCKYFVLFDALDDDYSFIFDKDSQFNEYRSLLTSLFKAVVEIKYSFKQSDINIFPVVFLRDDIFSLLDSNDKNKWNDRLITLNWSKDNLRKLVIKRINTAMKSVNFTKDEIMNEKSTILSIFSSETYSYTVRSKRRVVDILEYMLRSTILRPRDIIIFMRELCKYCLENDIEYCNVSHIKKAEHKYSDYLKQELENELHPIVENIGKVFDAIAKIRKEIFSRDEFQDKLRNEGYFTSSTQALQFNTLVEILYKFSVVGNITKSGNYRMFSFDSNRKDVDHQEQLCVHRGLIRSFHVADTSDLLTAEE